MSEGSVVEGEFRVVAPGEKVNAPVVEVTLPSKPEELHKKSLLQRIAGVFAGNPDHTQRVDDKMAATNRKMDQIEEAMGRIAEKIHLDTQRIQDKAATSRPTEDKVRDLEIEGRLRDLEHKIQPPK